MKLTHKVVHLKPTQKFEDWLASRSKGLQRIGTGLYANVYIANKKTSKRVVKVGIVDNDVIREGGMTRKRSSFNTDPYCEYLRRVVVAHQDNPFVPKVYSVELFTVHHTQMRRIVAWTRQRHAVPCVNYVYVVKMERLLKWNQMPHEVRSTALEKCGTRPMWKQPDDISLSNALGHNVHRNAKSSKNKHLMQIAPKLAKLYSNVRFSVDVHEGNVMWRVPTKGQAQLVITDPVA